MKLLWSSIDTPESAVKSHEETPQEAVILGIDMILNCNNQYNNYVAITQLEDVRQALRKHTFNTTLWNSLGLSLGLYKPTLSTIEYKHHTNSELCLQSCIEHWLTQKDNVNGTGGPTWSSLVRALRLNGENAVAEAIEREYL